MYTMNVVLQHLLHKQSSQIEFVENLSKKRWENVRSILIIVRLRTFPPPFLLTFTIYQRCLQHESRTKTIITSIVKTLLMWVYLSRKFHILTQIAWFGAFYTVHFRMLITFWWLKIGDWGSGSEGWGSRIGNWKMGV